MSARPLTRRNRAGTLLALFLLVVRLAAPTYVMPASADLAGLPGEVPICHADAGQVPPEPADKPTVPAHGAHGCALCPVCQLASAPLLLPAAAWFVAAPSAGRVRVALPPPATGPPPLERYAAHPRGPPAPAV